MHALCIYEYNPIYRPQLYHLNNQYNLCVAVLQLAWRSEERDFQSWVSLCLNGSHTHTHSSNQSAGVTLNSVVYWDRCAKKSKQIQAFPLSSSLLPRSSTLWSSFYPILFHVRLFSSSNSSFIFGQLQARRIPRLPPSPNSHTLHIQLSSLPSVLNIDVLEDNKWHHCFVLALLWCFLWKPTWKGSKKLLT